MMNKLNQRASLGFTESVILEELEVGDIVVTIEGPLKPYKFSYVIGPSTGYIAGKTVQSFFVQFNMKSTLLGKYDGEYLKFIYRIHHYYFQRQI